MKPRVRSGAATAAGIAEEIRRSLERHDEGEAWRWMLQFVDDFRASSRAGKMLLVQEPAALTGSNRHDAALAALVEHLCAQAGVGVPPWTWEPERLANPWWFVAGLPGLEAAAIRDSPISFTRHGVFVTAGAFERV